MTIGVSGRPTLLPLGGSEDPSLPTTIWTGDVESTGDASGGTNSVNIILSDPLDPDDAFWSLEQFGVQHDSVNAVKYIFQAVNQRNYRPGGTPITSTIMALSNAGTTALTGWVGRDLGWLPYFCGQGSLEGSAAQLFLNWSTENTLAAAFRLHCWGYRWGPRAVDTPTGPRRPLGSVFGH